jgi:hypothetical protein
MPEDKLSFIPQKKVEPTFYRGEGPGIVIIISFILFFVSVGSYGGLFLYKNSLQKNVDTLAQSLERAKAAFEISLINQISDTSQKINYSQNLLGSHTSVAPIFDFLEKDTLKSISFKSFKYSVDKDGVPSVLLEGLAKSYTDLALQGDVFEKESVVKSAVFSGIGLGEKGIINFTVKLIFDPSIIIYKIETGQ